MEGLVQALADENAVTLDKRKMETSLTPVDVILKDEKYLIRVDLPGVKLEDIDITIEDGVLIISGERRAPLEEFNSEYQISERSFGSFKRAFKLSDQIDIHSITADLSNGVLEISLPKKAKDALAHDKMMLIC